MLSHGGDKKQIHELIIEIVKVLSNIACRCNMRRKPKERIMLKILGLGNALVDVLTVLDSDDLLQRLSYPKGSMQLVGKEQSVELQNAIHDRERFFVTGGSASNTIAGLAKLGVSCGFIGKVGEDEEGSFFGRDMKSCGVEPFLIKSDLPTGVCVSLISPDSERTMITYLGAACELQSVDLKLSQFKGYDLFHIEGYLVQNYDLIETALKLAKEAGLKISLDLASYNVVEDNLEFLHRITSEYVDIIFANEEEAKSFTNGSKFSILHTVMQLSNRSRTTSYSISFHPFRLFSTNTCGENEKAFSVKASNSFSLSQHPEPRPPKAYAARIMTG